MKGLVVIAAFLAMLGLGVFLSSSKRYLKWTVLAIALPMAKWPSLSLMLLSAETYRGSTRGMEVSLPYLLAFAVMVALLFRGKMGKLFIDGGSVWFVLYWLLALPSLQNCENLTYAWFEVWKIPMMFLVYRAIRGYCRFTDDFDAPLTGLGIVSVLNFLEVVRQHFIVHVAQARGLFVHQNSMSIWTLLAAVIFFGAYLNLGSSRMRKFYCFCFVCSAAACVRTYSRGAMMCLPIGMGLTAMVSFFRNFTLKMPSRLMPLVPLVLIGGILAAPKIINRFEVASSRSGRMRVVFAEAAQRMIEDHPLAGVGLNNWGIKINPPYPYSHHREEFGMGPDFKDGIVETIYLLTWAECGTPCFIAFLGLYFWHLIKAFALTKKLKGDRNFWIAAGAFGGFSAIYLQSILEWALRQSINFCELAICFALIAALNEKYGKRKKKQKAKAVEKPKSENPEPSKMVQYTT